MPGRAIVGVKAIYGEFRQGAGAEAIVGLDEQGHFDTYRNPINPGKKWPTSMKEISPNEEDESIKVDFELDPGGQVEITMLDQKGELLSGVQVTGKTSSGSAKQVDSATFTATAFSPEEVRTILFLHKERNLGKVIRARADTRKEGISVRLEPCARITGRLVDSDEAARRFSTKKRRGLLPGQ